MLVLLLVVLVFDSSADRDEVGEERKVTRLGEGGSRWIGEDGAGCSGGGSGAGDNGTGSNGGSDSGSEKLVSGRCCSNAPLVGSRV